jgi:hypothetical protein
MVIGASCAEIGIRASNKQGNIPRRNRVFSAYRDMFMSKLLYDVCGGNLYSILHQTGILPEGYGQSEN